MRANYGKTVTFLVVGTLISICASILLANKFESPSQYILGLLYIYLRDDYILSGRFVPKYFSFLSRDGFLHSSINKFFQEGLEYGDDWEFLKQGFFNGQQSELKNALDKYNERLKLLGRNYY